MPAVSPDLNARQRLCIEEVLRTAQVAYVAMVDSVEPDGLARPYVVPMNFAYQPPAPAATPPGAEPQSAASEGARPHAAPALEGRLLLHTGPGRKADALARNPRVCVSVTSQVQLELGATPCDDGFHYQSVILEGRAELLSDEAQREQALRVIVAKHDPRAIAKPFKPNIFAQTLMYVVEVDTVGFKERPEHH